MVLFKKLTAMAVAVAALSVPMSVEAVVVVKKVHGPLKILPHHNHKYCRVHWVHHHRVKKCWYR